MSHMSDLHLRAMELGVDTNLPLVEVVARVDPELMATLSRHDVRERLIAAAARHGALAERARRRHDDTAELLNRGLALGIAQAALALGVYDAEYLTRSEQQARVWADDMEAVA